MLSYSTMISDKDKKEFENKIEKVYQKINSPEKTVSFDWYELLSETLSMARKFMFVDVQNEIQKLVSLLLNEGATDAYFQQLKKVEYVSSAETKLEPYIDIRNEYVSMYADKTKRTGVSFLCPEIDKRTGGVSKGTIASIVGGTGCMKTTYALNMAYNEIKRGGNVVFLSLEETRFNIYSKLLSRHSVDIGKKIPVQDIITRNLDEKSEETLLTNIHVSFDEYEGNIFIIGEDQLGTKTQKEILDRLKEIDDYIKEKTNNSDKGIDVLMVDHLQMFKYCTIEKKSEFEIMNSYVNFFNSQSKSFLGEKREVAVVLLSQVNREGMAYAQKNDGMYKIQHVAEASEIERASSYVISVYTDAMTQVTKLLKLGCIKLRGAALPMEAINVYADGAHYQVGDIVIPEQQEYSIDNLDSDTDNSFSADVDNLSLDDLLGGF